MLGSSDEIFQPVNLISAAGYSSLVILYIEAVVLLIANNISGWVRSKQGHNSSCTVKWHLKPQSASPRSSQPSVFAMWPWGERGLVARVKFRHKNQVAGFGKRSVMLDQRVRVSNGMRSPVSWVKVMCFSFHSAPELKKKNLRQA